MASFLSMDAQKCPTIKDGVDEFTGEYIYQTKPTNISGAFVYSTARVDRFLAFTLYTDYTKSWHTTTESPWYFKMTDGEVIKLYPYADAYSEYQSEYSYKETVSFILTEDEILSLKGKELEKIRPGFVDHLDQFNIKKRKRSLFADRLNCLMETSTITDPGRP